MEKKIKAENVFDEEKMGQEEEVIEGDIVESEGEYSHGEGEPKVNGDESLLDPGNMEGLLAAEKAKSEDYYNRLLRMQADFENFRKRVSKEREDLLRYGAEQLLTELLPVLDNLDRAISVDTDDHEKLLAGVQMIVKQLQDTLTKEGVEIIPTVGELFNPEVHEAVMKEESEEYCENTVTMELRRGYTYQGKILRAAMVKVSG